VITTLDAFERRSASDDRHEIAWRELAIAVGVRVKHRQGRSGCGHAVVADVSNAMCGAGALSVNALDDDVLDAVSAGDGAPAFDAEDHLVLHRLVLIGSALLFEGSRLPLNDQYGEGEARVARRARGHHLRASDGSGERCSPPDGWSHAAVLTGSGIAQPEDGKMRCGDHAAVTAWSTGDHGVSICSLSRAACPQHPDKLVDLRRHRRLELSLTQCFVRTCTVECRGDVSVRHQRPHESERGLGAQRRFRDKLTTPSNGVRHLAGALRALRQFFKDARVFASEPRSAFIEPMLELRRILDEHSVEQRATVASDGHFQITASTRVFELCHVALDHGGVETQQLIAGRDFGSAELTSQRVERRVQRPPRAFGSALGPEEKLKSIAAHRLTAGKRDHSEDREPLARVYRKKFAASSCARPLGASRVPSARKPVQAAPITRAVTYSG
jgi:hypothetical protein